MIVSFNGLDGSGKTTQILNIKETFSTDTRILLDIELSESIFNLSNNEFHNWWFKLSSPDDFCNELYKAMKKREEKIKANNKFVLVDKGISTFDARIWSTLILKGLTREEAFNTLKKYKLKYNIKDMEDLKILLIRKDCNNEKINNLNYSDEEKQTYFKYISLQKEFIYKLKKYDYYYYVVEVNDSIDQTSKNIFKLMSDFDSCNCVKQKYEESDVDILNINVKEKRIISEIYNEAINIFKKNLIMFFIHGSVSRKRFIANWSDVDIIICLENYEHNGMQKLSNFTKKYNLEVGLTAYSKNEIESKMIDAKSLYSFYQYNIGNINSMIYLNGLKLPKLTLRDLKNKNLSVIPESIHKLKRLLYQEINEKNFKEIFKLLALVIKVILINKNNIVPKSYYSIFYNFSYIYNLNLFNVDLIIKENNFKGLKDYSIEVIECVSNQYFL